MATAVLGLRGEVRIGPGEERPQSGQTGADDTKSLLNGGPRHGTHGRICPIYHLLWIVGQNPQY